MKVDILAWMLIQIRNLMTMETKFIFFAAPGGWSPIEYHLAIVDGDSFPSTFTVNNGDMVEISFLLGTAGQMGADYIITLTDALPPS
jgi:hypothetical protein